MYVGAFLKLPDRNSTQASGFPLASSDSTAPAPAQEGQTHSAGAAAQQGDAAAKLHEVGTFAQVHTIGQGEGPGAQLLLFGHRRLRRIRTVSSFHCQLLLQSGCAYTRSGGRTRLSVSKSCSHTSSCNAASVRVRALQWCLKVSKHDMVLLDASCWMCNPQRTQLLRSMGYRINQLVSLQNLCPACSEL